LAVKPAARSPSQARVARGTVQDDKRGASLANLVTAATTFNQRKAALDEPLADQIRGTATLAQVDFASLAPAWIRHMVAIRIVRNRRTTLLTPSCRLLS
jgi:hypothetical protein